MKSHEANSDSLAEASKESRREVATIKEVVEEQRGRLDGAGARMTELKDRRDEASASTAICRKELLQEQKNLETALEKLNFRLARSVAMTRDWDVVSTAYEKLRSSAEQPTGFARIMTSFKAEVVMVTLEWDAIAAKVVQLTLEALRVLCLAEKAMKLREREWALVTTARAKVSKSGKSPATGSKQKNSDAEAKVAQACLELGAWDARVAELEACAIKGEKQLKQRS